MITIGSDTHLKSSTMTVLDSNGCFIERKRLKHTKKDLLEFIKKFPGPKQFSIETCYTWPAIYELLKDEVSEFHLLQASRLKSVTESQSKCDPHDADEIARLTHAGYIPIAHKANAHTRSFRSLLRTRVDCSLARVQVKNRIQAILNTNILYGERPESFKNLFSKKGIEYLTDLELSDGHKFIIEQCLQQLNEYDSLIERYEEKIKSIEFHHDDLSLLRSVPGMNGKVLCYVVLAEIDGIQRFKNSDKLVSYAGLIPKNFSSGGKTRSGRLKTACNQWLKWAMLQSVNGALKKDPGLKQYYDDIKAKTNSSVARVSTARRLLKNIYHVLKEQRKYYPFHNRR